MNELQAFRYQYFKSSVRYHLATFVLGYPLEAWNWLSALFAEKNEPETKFVIFTAGRSGSTLLVDLLNSNPAVQCDDELLKRRVLFPMQQINLHAKQSSKPIYGFKLLSYQLKNVQTSIHDKKAFFNTLLENDYKLIYLERENKVLQALSIVYAFHHNKWHNRGGGSGKQKAPPFEMDLKIFYQFLDGMVELTEFEHELLAGYPHLSLSYEKDLQDNSRHVNTVERLSDFLGISMAPPSTTLRKATPEQLSKFIRNKEELLDSLRHKSQYAHYVPILERM